MLTLDPNLLTQLGQLEPPQNYPAGTTPDPAAFYLLADGQFVTAGQFAIKLLHTAIAATPITPAFYQQHPNLAQAISHQMVANQANQALLQAMERDLFIGRQIQQSFLPETIEQPAGWQIAPSFQPARQVAGDFYDVFPVAHGRRIALVLADVCDKGVGAALFMALFRSLIRVLAEQNYSSSLTDFLQDEFSGGGSTQMVKTGLRALQQTITLTNNYVARQHGKTNMFATIFLGLLDPQNGSLAYINGGHEPPILFGPQGVQGRLLVTGPAVGMMADMPFQIESVQLRPGEGLLIFTDGVLDARDPAGASFGEPALLKLLTPPLTSAKTLLATIESQLASHIAQAAPADDITMLAIRRER